MRLQRDNPTSPPLQVETREGMPFRLWWRGQWLRVTSAHSIECVEGRWWLDWENRGVKRRTFRVSLADGRGPVFNIDLVKQGPEWKLSQILD